MTSEKSQSKRELRSAMRRVLLEVAPGDGTEVRRAVADWLRDHPELTVIAAYAAMAGEVDLVPLVDGFPGRCWLFPRVVGDDLMLHEVVDPARDLVVGAFGIREPSASLPVVRADEVEAFLCPGLAFDGRGGRLGRGRGFYDRMLGAAHPSALRVGVCHPVQQVSDTFSEPHDIPMHRVIDGATLPP
jgi:5-formyltetrahydrofolate cyclo-ligase